MSQDQSPIIEFEAATAGVHAGGNRYDTGLWNVSFRLDPGELLLLRAERALPRLPIGDLALGLIEPSRGVVRCMGKRWGERITSDVVSTRARIGRYPGSSTWLRRLSVEQNITLMARFHTHMRGRDIVARAEALCRAFGLPGLPRGEPGSAMEQDLARAACARMLMLDPELIVLDRPAQGIGLDILPTLMNQISAARRRGAAVIWITTDDTVYHEPAIRPTRRCLMTGAQMVDAAPLPTSEAA